MTSSTISPVLNPNTPMALLPADLADIQQVSAYIYFACVGALAWDWLMSMPDEYQILSVRGPWTPKIAYVCARIFTFTFCLCSAIFQVTAVSNCKAMMYAITILAILAFNTTNLLFFFRVRAVYGNSRSITAFFGVCYIIVFGVSLCEPFALHAEHLGPIRLCIEVDAPDWSVAPMLCNAVNDTLVFLAISYRITSQSMGGKTWSEKLKGFFRGKGASHVARNLLHNGQLYYLATTVMNVAEIATALSSPYVIMLTVPAIALQSAMTCRVHRGVIQSLIARDECQSGPLILTSVIADNSDYITFKEHDINIDVKTNMSIRQDRR